MTAKRVYIVIERDYCTGDGVFRDVFFTKEAAEAWIKEYAVHVDDFEIGSFEESENGKSKEIY